MKRVKKLIHHLHRQLLRARAGHHMRRWHKLERELVRARTAKKNVEESHREGVDVSWGRPDPHALKRAGKDFIVGYLSNVAGLRFTHADMVRYSKAGLEIGLVFEKQQDAPLGGKRVGRAHAHEALEIARREKVPHGTQVNFAVDLEATGEEVAGYFVGVHEVLKASGWEIEPGVYGRKIVTEYVGRHGLVVGRFQTYAWSDHEWDEEAELHQVLIDLPADPLRIDGVAVDYCKTVGRDWGGFKVGA